MQFKDLITRVREGVAVSTEQLAEAVNGDASPMSRRDVDAELRRFGAVPISNQGDNFWSPGDVLRFLGVQHGDEKSRPTEAA